jgi:DNA-binding CsgD family transcriptional regulator
MQESLFAQGLRVSGLLLEAVTAPEQLRVALELLTAMAGADAGLLACARRGEGRVDSMVVNADGTGCAPDGEARAFPAFDPYRRWSAAQPEGRLYFGEDAERFAHGSAGPDAPENRPAEAYCMGHVHAGEDRVCYLGFARRDSAGACGFDPERVRVVASLLPQLRQCVAIAHRLESMQALNSTVMDRFERYHVGVVLVDDECSLQYCNLAAHRLLEAGNGLCLDPLGRLAAREPADDAALRRSLRNTIGGGLSAPDPAPGLLKVRRAREDTPLVIAITPYRGVAGSLLRGGSRGSAVVMIHDPDSPPVTRRDLVRRVLELSEQESQLVCALAEGASLEDFAQRSGRSLEAVRSQLKRVFRKTGTSRQVELVRMVLSGPTAMAQ